MTSFNEIIEKSIIDNWDLDALTDYKGITLHGAAARLLFETWEQTDSLLKQGLRLDQIVTHELPLEQFSEGLDLMEQGKCGKCLLIP